MRTIKFNTIAFELQPNGIIVHSDHLSAAIVKGDYTVDDIIAELDGTTTATIAEDGETVSVYNGYSKILAVSYYKDYDNEEDPKDTVSVELINSDIQEQINNLFNNIENLHSVQDSQAQTITGLSDEVNRKLDAGVIGDVETIGAASSKSYDVGDTFAGSDGKMYRVIVPIITGATLVVGGNCELTSISEELNSEE